MKEDISEKNSSFSFFNGLHNPNKKIPAQLHQQGSSTAE